MADEDKVTEKVEEEVAETAEAESKQGEGGKTLEEVNAELAQVRSALKKANAEAAERRKRLDAIDAAEQKRQKSEMDEGARLKGEVADWERKFNALEEELRTERVKGAVEKAARAAGVVEDAVSDAYALIDFAMLEFDDDGQPTNVDDAVKNLVKAKPYLMRQSAPAGDNDAKRGKGGAPQQMTEAERQAFADRYGVQTQYIK